MKENTVRKLTGYLICQTDADIALIHHYLPEHQRLSRAEPGCVSFAVTETENPLIWQVDELFVDAQAFELHQQRTRASEWGTATAGIARKYEISDSD